MEIRNLLKTVCWFFSQSFLALEMLKWSPKFWHSAACLLSQCKWRDIIKPSKRREHLSYISGGSFWQVCNIQVELWKDLPILSQWQITVRVPGNKKSHKRKLEWIGILKTFYLISLLFLPCSTSSRHESSCLPWCPQQEIYKFTSW